MVKTFVTSTSDHLSHQLLSEVEVQMSLDWRTLGKLWVRLARIQISMLLVTAPIIQVPFHPFYFTRLTLTDDGVSPLEDERGE